MSNKSKQQVSQTKKNIARALLIVGLVLSIQAFVASIGLLLLYFGVYLAVVVIILYIVAYAALSVFAVFIMIYMIVAIFAVLFGATSLDFLGNSGLKIEEVFPPEAMQQFGKYSLYYLIGLPIIIMIILSSLASMIFAIISLTRLNKSKSKTGGIVGGVFGILSAFTGWFSLTEFAGGVLMFFISSKEYAAGHEEDEPVPNQQKTNAITRKEVIDYTK